jgi:hypothetical protein
MFRRRRNLRRHSRASMTSKRLSPPTPPQLPPTPSFLPSPPYLSSTPRLPPPPLPLLDHVLLSLRNQITSAPPPSSGNSGIEKRRWRRWRRGTAARHLSPQPQYRHEQTVSLPPSSRVVGEINRCPPSSPPPPSRLSPSLLRPPPQKPLTSPSRPKSDPLTSFTTSKRRVHRREKDRGYCCSMCEVEMSTSGRGLEARRYAWSRYR